MILFLSIPSAPFPNFPSLILFPPIIFHPLPFFYQTSFLVSLHETLFFFNFVVIINSISYGLWYGCVLLITGINFTFFTKSFHLFFSIILYYLIRYIISLNFIPNMAIFTSLIRLIRISKWNKGKEKSLKAERCLGTDLLCASLLLLQGRYFSHKL